MEPTLISCIIPVFNGERYLGEALDSVVTQTYRPIEIIVVDDGSTDGTASVIERFQHEVQYLFQANSGTAAARNLGLNAARGEYVAFLDADDLWHPEKIARQLARFRTRPELAGSVTHVMNFWSPDLCTDSKPPTDKRVFVPIPGYVPQTLLARRALFDAIGGFNAALRHADSTEWFLRAEDYGSTIELLADVLVHRRLHRSNQSHRFATASRGEYLHLLKTRLDRRRGR